MKIQVSRKGVLWPSFALALIHTNAYFIPRNFICHPSQIIFWKRTIMGSEEQVFNRDLKNFIEFRLISSEFSV